MPEKYSGKDSPCPQGETFINLRVYEEVMAKHKRGRRRRRGRKAIWVPFQSILSLGTLADDTVVQQGLLASALLHDAWIIAVRATWSLRDLTPGQGPIEVGVSHSDLSVAEVKEYLNADVREPDNIIANEHRRRPARRVGIFHGNDDAESLNHGTPAYTKCGWRNGEGHQSSMWAYNSSGAALSTTVPEVVCSGHVLLVWT